MTVKASTATPTLPAHGGRMAWNRLLDDRSAVAGLAIVVLLIVAAGAAPWLAPRDPSAVDVANKLAAPSADHLLGTDELGRDLLSRVLYGARVSLGTTLVAAAAISFVGVALGTLAGYIGGWVDSVISRLIDLLLAFPSFLLALGITAVLGPGLFNVVVAVVVVWWAGYARVVRAAVLVERERPYIEAATALGMPTWRVLLRHVVPNVVGPVVVLSTLELGAVLLALSGFSFLGLGVQPPTSEWGAMLSEGRVYMGSAPFLMVPPGACIFFVVLGCNLLGDGLRDALDPRRSTAR